VAARNGEPDLAIGHYRIFLQASSAKKSAKGWASTLKAMFEIALSTAHFAQGEIEDAEYQANLAYTQALRESDALLAGYARINLAAIASAKRAWIEALEMYRDGLPLLLERPHAGAVACGLAGLANLAIQLEAFSTAGELIALSRLLAAAGTPGPPNLICFDVDLLSARLPATGKSAVSPSSVTRWSELQPLIDDAVDDLLNTLRPEPVSKERRAPDALTRRELEALCLATEGMTNREIADALFIGTRTAEDHMQKVMSKLGVNNRAGAIARALREGWCS
jgi:DNA-binding CsgD family transcriptional regulator